MWLFAWENLLSRPSRTVLAVVGLFSLSAGIRNLARDTLGQVEGLMVLRENVPVAILSDLPAELVHTIRQVPEVRVVAPEVWKIAPSIVGPSGSGKDPGLILADEPTGELDSRAGDEIFAILREHQDERRSTLVVVTHAHRFINASDQVLELEDGRLREDGDLTVTSGMTHCEEFRSGGSLESPPE